MTEPDRQRIARDLRSLVAGEVRFGRHDRMLYATDASIYQVEPIGVVVLRRVEEVEPIVRYCAERGLPVLPRGGGTSLAGQAVNRAVVIDFSAHCRRITDLDPVRALAVVEPGVVLDSLNAAAAPHGLMFGPDVATTTHATLGGMIGNNSAGARSILYGRTVEHVEALDAVGAVGAPMRLAQGAAGGSESAAALARGAAAIVRPLAAEIWKRYPRTTRRVNGYNLDLVLDELEASSPGTLDRVNLAHLVCGAEGTLAVVTSATVRLVRRPARTGLVIAAFSGLQEALSAVGAILETKPAAVELIDDVIIGLAEGNAECRRHVALLPSLGGSRPGAVLYVEYFAEDEAGIARRFRELAGVLGGEAATRTYTAPREMHAAWTLRRAGEPLLHALPGDRKPVAFVEDTAVDPRRLAEFVEEFRGIVAAHGTATAACYAHASVGCLHIRPLIRLRDPADRAAMEAIAIEVTDLVLRYEGALSGEHGDGRARSGLLERFYGKRVCEAFAAIKALFDPAGILNPGIIVRPAPMGESLRVQPAGRPVLVPAVGTFFRYDSQGGFANAVEACNGAGVCRKTSGGTMCPSYRALLDERHATRGRGNALRLAITGQLGRGAGPAWDDPETIETLDLCLSCKACKSECPSNVDVARLKAEYTGQRYAAGGRVAIRDRMMSHVRLLHRLGSALRPIARAGPAARLAGACLGIDRRRSLPPIGPSLYRWAAKRGVPDAGGPAVILFPDCFAVWGEPNVGRAAFGVLAAAGIRAVLPRLGCCGRALLSAGMLREAQRVCAATARGLLEAVAAHGAVAVVVCEPSCASAITDDWPDLVMDVDRRSLRDLAAKTSLVEAFVSSHWPEQPSQAPVRSGAPVLLHGHCHQKALFGAESSAGLLKRLVGDRLVVLDAGCCGMAGAFGLVRRHYDLSMAIGELALFPAIRNHPDATIAAPGASCRHQIRDGTGREALHPIEMAERITRPP